MKIHNVRMGLATNSSSTHSLIFMSPADYSKTRTDEYHEFGWGYFTAADRTSKENYLGHTLLDGLSYQLGADLANLVVDGLFSNRKNFSNELRSSSGYVDHQSRMSFPNDWSGKGLDVTFFKAFRDYIVKKPIAILGGNDNGDYANAHPNYHLGTPLELGLPEDYGYSTNLVARDDGNHWVIFNRDSGSKVRLSFTSKDAKVTAFKAAEPELVDIKITDYCPFGCEYCYMGSTTEGTHGDYNLISSIAYSLEKLKVFEVAIGGGEPTLHPDFIRILEAFRHNGIVPNFTTRNTAWLNDDEKTKKILAAAGAFAVSVTTREDVIKLMEALEKSTSKNLQYKVSVQYVLESGGDLAGVLDECAKRYVRLTLLGFKTTGFGKDFPTVPENWMDVVKKAKTDHRWMNLGVDTAIIQKYGERIKDELGVSDKLMTKEEGKFSMYIDAVTKRMGPSSYCDEKEFVELPSKPYDLSTDISVAFGGF